MKRLLLVALLAGAHFHAHAALVQVQLLNASGSPIDYSAQMANYSHDHATNRTYLGKQITAWIGYEPILGPSEISPSVPYATTGPGQGSDAISLNLRARKSWNEQVGWRYASYGMKARILGGPHSCDVHAGGPIHDGETILLDLRQHWFWPYALHEILPNGDSCTFYLDENFGPVVWGPVQGGATSAEPVEPGSPGESAGSTSAPRADIPGVTRALTGAELAVQAPSLLAQLDADYLRATGVDLRAVRARHAAARESGL